MNTLCEAKRRLKIVRAAHLGMCFGVRDAIALARAKAKEEPLTVLGDLVHNESVLEDLRSAGVTIESDPARVKTAAAMITAHGASERAMERARAHGLNLLEATCPLVHHAHRAVRELVEQGFHPVIIGKRGHVEVRGLTEDLEVCDIIESTGEVEQLAVRPRLGIAAQTTQPIEHVRSIVNRIRGRFPDSEIRFVDTVCQPTKQRQRAARELAAESDVVIVVGGSGSNNTRELVRTCATLCEQVHHVQQPADLRRGWFENASRIGITAGTSTPDYLIAAVEEEIRRLIE